MKRFFLWTIVIGIVAGGGAAGYQHFHGSAGKAGDSVYRTAPVKRGDITSTRTSSGTVQPVLSVQVGAVVSGPIRRGLRQLQRKGQEGQLLAEIDPTGFKATVDQAEASLACTKANLLQAEAKLEQTKREWKRAQRPLAPEGDRRYRLRFGQVQLRHGRGERGGLQGTDPTEPRRLGLSQDEPQLHRDHLAVDGIVTDRKVDPGQSLASAYQTPVLFVVAPDLEKRVYVSGLRG